MQNPIMIVSLQDFLAICKQQGLQVDSQQAAAIFKAAKPLRPLDTTVICTNATTARKLLKLQQQEAPYLADFYLAYLQTHAAKGMPVRRLQKGDGNYSHFQTAAQLAESFYQQYKKAFSSRADAYEAYIKTAIAVMGRRYRFNSYKQWNDAITERYDNIRLCQQDSNPELTSQLVAIYLQSYNLAADDNAVKRTITSNYHCFVIAAEYCKEYNATAASWMQAQINYFNSFNPPKAVEPRQLCTEKAAERFVQYSRAAMQQKGGVNWQEITKKNQ